LTPLETKASKVLELKLKPLGLAGLTSILTNHLLTSLFFRETVTSKTHKTFPKAALTLTRLQDAGRHRASVLHLDNSSTNVFSFGIRTSGSFINFRRMSPLRHKSESLLALPFSHSTGQALLRKRVRAGTSNTRRFYEVHESDTVRNISSFAFYKSPYLNLTFTVGLLLTSATNICGGLSILRKNSLKRKTRKPAKPVSKARKSLNRAKYLFFCKLISPQAVKLLNKTSTGKWKYSLILHLLRVKTLITNFTSLRLSSKYLKLKRRYFPNRNKNFINYVTRIMTKTPHSRNNGNSGVRIPFFLRKEVFASKKVSRRLKNKFKSFKKRQVLIRKSFFINRNKFLSRRYLSLKKRNILKLK
jgi:hypothetical protein